ncbi:MAG: type II toxin-antitoxin system VapB family antitoxin [Candidatus Aminicenantes bacterium]|nr:type II toxin-antitoxin system VapB family antitoxin [Candidatus Aminicenantes bacterium]
MRTTLIIPDDLMKDLMAETGETSKTELVRRSLEEMLKRVRRENLKRLRGKVGLDLDLDALRKKDLL